MFFTRFLYIEIHIDKFRYEPYDGHIEKYRYENGERTSFKKDKFKPPFLIEAQYEITRREQWNLPMPWRGQTPCRAAHDVPEHGLAVDEGQGFAWKSRAFISGRNDGDDVRHGNSGENGE